MITSYLILLPLWTEHRAVTSDRPSLLAETPSPFYACQLRISFFVEPVVTAAVLSLSTILSLSSTTPNLDSTQIHICNPQLPWTLPIQYPQRVICPMLSDVLYYTRTQLRIAIYSIVLGMSGQYTGEILLSIG
jgi:hypothetical protein